MVTQFSVMLIVVPFAICQGLQYVIFVVRGRLLNVFHDTMTQLRFSTLSACNIVAHLLIEESGVFAVTCNISCDPHSRADREASQYSQGGAQL